MTVLVIDDEKNIRATLSMCLQDIGCHVTAVGSSDAATAALERQAFDLVFLDLHLGDVDGLDVLPRLLGQRPELTVVVTTAYATIDTAVEAMKRGASDYLPKPFAPAEIRRVVEHVARRNATLPYHSALVHDLLVYSSKLPMEYESHAPHPSAVLESANAEMAAAISTARQVAPSDVAVLLSGESGTGKHVLAAAIHEWSPRSAGPFVTVRPTVRSAPRHEDEPFPHFDSSRDDRWIGAADRGTVFFEEVGDLGPAQQAKLIRLLDEDRFGGGEGESVEADIRVIAATVRDLGAECLAGRFRGDLLFHLSTVHIRLPPLRERLDDLGRLTDCLVARLIARYHRGGLRVAPAVHQVLARYSWPGNVRELESIIERGVVLSRGDTMTIDELPERLLGRPRESVTEPSHPLSLQDVERHHIEEAIRASATLREAATRLGIDATTLWRKRKLYGLR